MIRAIWCGDSEIGVKRPNPKRKSFSNVKTPSVGFFWRQNTHNNPIFSLKTHHSRQVLEFICTPSWKQAKHHFKSQISFFSYGETFFSPWKVRENKLVSTPWKKWTYMLADTIVHHFIGNLTPQVEKSVANQCKMVFCSIDDVTWPGDIILHELIQNNLKSFSHMLK